jgi:hypothetical protein
MMCGSNSIKIPSFQPTQQDHMSEKNSIQGESFMVMIDGFFTGVCTVQPHLIFFTALRNPLYPWFAQGGW